MSVCLYSPVPPACKTLLDSMCTSGKRTLYTEAACMVCLQYCDCKLFYHVLQAGLHICMHHSAARCVWWPSCMPSGTLAKHGQVWQLLEEASSACSRCASCLCHLIHQCTIHHVCHLTLLSLSVFMMSACNKHVFLVSIENIAML